MAAKFNALCTIKNRIRQIKFSLAIINIKKSVKKRGEQFILAHAI